MYHDINEVSSAIEILLKNYQQAALGTNNGKYPDVTKVTPILFDDDNIYLLLSDLSNHTRNIRNVSNTVSLYFADEHKHATAMNNARLTLYGHLTECETALKNTMLSAFDERDKGASFYGNFGDFNIWKFEEDDRLYIRGFGKAYK